MPVAAMLGLVLEVMALTLLVCLFPKNPRSQQRKLRREQARR